MSEAGEEDVEELARRADEWVLRLTQEPVGEADWIAFVAWLDGAPSHDSERRRRAFDQAQGLWLEAEGRYSRPKPPRRRASRRGHPAIRRRTVGVLASAGLAAAVVGTVAVVVERWPERTPALEGPTSYATAAGERRLIVLADGDRMALDGRTRVSVTAMGSARREVVLEAGEVSFDVVHDPSRPFRVALGASAVWVLGTAFDVVRSGEDATVAVKRGAVSFDTPSGSVRLAAGEQATLSNRIVKVRPINPADADAWQKGRRLYWDQPLAAVIADLNRTYAKPLQIGDAAAERLRFSGVLVLGPETEMVRRLTALLPLRATFSPGGAIVLSTRDPEA